MIFNSSFYFLPASARIAIERRGEKETWRRAKERSQPSRMMAVFDEDQPRAGGRSQTAGKTHVIDRLLPPFLLPLVRGEGGIKQRVDVDQKAYGKGRNDGADGGRNEKLTGNFLSTF